MKPVKLMLSLSAVLMLLSFTAAASMIIPSNDNAKENAKAPEKSPVIGDLWGIERVDFIHYAKPVAPAKPGADACYKLMGVKWLSFPVSYAINPTNPQQLDEQFILSSMSTAAETWDIATSKELFNDAYAIDYSAVYGIRDYKNSIVFGDYGNNNVIAVTSVWYSRVGKQIVEFDQLYNTRFTWGDAAIDPSLMDLQNIAAHELGHAVGLSDLYTNSCTAVTMYGYSNNGDIAKRTLEQPDITGLQKMYGI